MHRVCGYLCFLLVLTSSVSGVARPRSQSQEMTDIYTRISKPFSAHRFETPVRLKCDASVCSTPEINSLLSTLATPPQGIEVSAGALMGVWSRLMKTGYFARVLLTLEPVGQDRVSLSVTCVGVVQITSINVRYDGWQSWLYPKQFIAEIRKRLPLRRGGPFPPKDSSGDYMPADVKLIRGYERRIEQLYEEQGYLGTRVRIKSTYHGDRNRLVDVVIRIREGEQPAMGQVLVSGAVSYPYWRISNAFSTGERIDMLRETLGIFGYGRYARKMLKAEVLELEAQYRDDGYLTAKLRLQSKTFERDGIVHPRLRIREGPKIEVEYGGNRSLSNDALAKVLTFRESGVIDTEEIESSRQAILTEYQSVARYFASVTAEVLVQTPRLVRVRYVIDEGPRVFISRVSIDGNQLVSDAALKALMSTKGVAPNGVINSLVATDGVLQDASVINDLNAIKAYYAGLGVPGVVFRCAPLNMSPTTWTALNNFEPNPSLAGPQTVAPLLKRQVDFWSSNPVEDHCFRVKPTSDPRLLELIVELREGKRTITNRPDVTDVIMYNMDEQMREEAFLLLQSLGFLDELRRWKKNVGLNTRKIKAIQGFLLRFYHQEGYLAATVTPQCKLGDGAGDPPEQSCSEIRLYGAKVKSLRFKVVKGSRTKAQGVLLRGNLRTAPQVIYNELRVEPGKPLGTDEIFISQANLRSLGIFDAVNVEYIGHPLNASAKVDTQGVVRDATVVVSVEESKAKSLDLYVGAQIDSTVISDELPVLYTVGGSVRDRNFFGRGLELGLGFNHANRVDDPFDYRGDDALWQAGPFLKNRRFLGTRLDLTMEALYQLSETAQRDAYQQVNNVDATLGYDFYALSYPSKWGQGLRTTLGFELRRERLRELSRGGERPSFGESTDSFSLSPAVTWDQRDTPLHPTRGFYVSTAVDFVVPSVGKAVDLPTKLTFSSHYVQSFLKRQLIVVPNIKIGSVWTGRDETDLKANFLFKAGGDGVTIPVRGYTNASIDACRGSETAIVSGRCADVYPEGVQPDDPLAEASTVGGHAMVAGGLELRFPTFLVDDLWGTIYSDFAAISPYWRTLNAERIYSSVGGGLRYLVTGQIPLRLDVAYPLRETPFSEQEVRVHVNIFYTL